MRKLNQIEKHGNIWDIIIRADDPAHDTIFVMEKYISDELDEDILDFNLEFRSVGLRKVLDRWDNEIEINAMRVSFIVINTAPFSL